MTTRSLSGHTLSTPGTPLGEWLKALGFTAGSPAYQCSKPTVRLKDFPPATHGHHTVGHRGRSYHLREVTKVTDLAITGGYEVWTGRLDRFPEQIRVVATLNPNNGNDVLFYQAFTDATPNPQAVLQILHCMH